ALKNTTAGSSILEILFVVGCVLISEWLTPVFFGKNWIAGAAPACVALAFIVISQISKGEIARDLGWRADNFFEAIAILLLPTLAASLFLIAIGYYFDSLRSADVTLGWPLFWTGFGLVVWGLVQQYPLQAFINRRAQGIWGKGTRSILFVASIFALLHLPNFWLVAATFFGGLMWAYVYQRVPNLWALALAHAVMTAVLVMTVPYTALHGLRVGYNYFW
ncbi:MAG: CPBP family glutamic-type intramembrane protease, partial [Pyrinomonadaceae bacterium]